MAIETWKFVQEKSKQAMKQVLGIKDEAARLRVTPPLAVAPLAHGEDMRWDLNDDGINFNPLHVSLCICKGDIRPGITVRGSIQHPSTMYHSTNK